MCILFLYVADKPVDDSFKVILAVNRDEMYKRPTAPAHFWGTNPEIIGGVDKQPGREGGTWLGFSKNGKIAALLNVLQSKESLAKAGEKRGRGFIVNNFLTSDKSGIEYMNELHKAAKEYSPFNLLTIDKLHEDSPNVCFYSCAEDEKPRQLPVGTVLGIGNSRMNAPFMKVKTGQQQIADIIREKNHVSKKEELIESILGVLRNEEKFFPDQQIIDLASGQPETFIYGISSRFIKLPGYGTRTHTFILVDFNNHVYFQETTLEDPTEDNSKWSTSMYNFSLNKEHE